MPDIQPYLQRMVAQVSKPEVQAALRGYTRDVQLHFSDTQESWLIRLVDGQRATLSQETLEKPDITVTTTTQVLAGIIDGTINPGAAFMSGQFKINASMADMLRLQKLM